MVASIPYRVCIYRSVMSCMKILESNIDCGIISQRMPALWSRDSGVLPSVFHQGGFTPLSRVMTSLQAIALSVVQQSPARDAHPTHEDEPKYEEYNGVQDPRCVGPGVLSLVCTSTQRYLPRSELHSLFDLVKRRRRQCTRAPRTGGVMSWPANRTEQES